MQLSSSQAALQSSSPGALAGHTAPRPTSSHRLQALDIQQERIPSGWTSAHSPQGRGLQVVAGWLGGYDDSTRTPDADHPGRFG